MAGVICQLLIYVCALRISCSQKNGNKDLSKPLPSASGKQGTKRKHDNKTIEFKYAAIMEVEKGVKSKAQIARDLGLNSSTLSTWLNQSDSIKQGYEKFGPKRRNMRKGKWEELEDAVLKWFAFARDQDAVISGPVLIAKAEQFAKDLRIDDFKGTHGWMERFKDRHGIAFHSISGESNSVDQTSDSMKDWNNRLRQLLNRYHPDDIFNADETGLFYKMLPEKTLSMKGTDCNGGKRSKERLTVLVCSNMTGSDKRPLLVIRKSGKPRCFKNLKTLPTEYTFNKKSWMTGELFTNWVKNLNREMKRQSRKVALVLDNAPCHPKLRDLSNIELVFLPANTTDGSGSDTKFESSL